MGMKMLAALLLILGLGVAPKTSSADGVHGHIYEGFADHRTPVSGVAVGLSGPTGTFTTQTNALGFFAILGLAPGTYQVTLTRPGFVTSVWGGLNMEPGETSTVSFLMFRRGFCCYDPVSNRRPALLDPDQTADVYNIH